MYNSKLDTVRRLLALAEGAATEHERDAANAKATALITRHGIDEALLAAEGAKREAVGKRRIAMSDPYSKGKANLLCWIASALGCQPVMHGLSGGTAQCVTIFGYESDLDRAELLYTSLLLQATAALQRARPPSWSDETVSAFRRSWLNGFSVTVSRRLKDAVKRATEQAQNERAPGAVSTELVLVDRSKVVVAAMQRTFPNLRPGTRSRLSGSGYGDGSRAGARADIGGKRVGSSRVALA